MCLSCFPQGDIKTGFCSCKHSYEPMGYIHIQKPQGVLESTKEYDISHSSFRELRRSA